MMTEVRADTDQYTMKELLKFTEEKNPLWPFGAAIANQEGEILVYATDCAHISPLFHAETLAIHALATHKIRGLKHLTLYCTTEPDHLSLSALYWAQITHELVFEKIVYGSSAQKIQELFPFSLNLPMEHQERVMQALSDPNRHQVLEEECDKLFDKAKQKQIDLNIPHPGRLLSKNPEDFYQLNIKMLQARG